MALPAEPPLLAPARPTRSPPRNAERPPGTQLVCAEPQSCAHGRIEPVHRPLAERLDRVVERPRALDGPDASWRARARSRSSRPPTAPRRARSAYAPSSKTRSTTSNAARRAGATTAARAAMPRTPLGARRPAAPRRLELPVLVDAGAPDRQGSALQLALAPMCGESARTRRTSSTAGLEVQLTVCGRDLVRVGAPSAA